MDYIRWIREKVGHEKIFLNFAGGELTKNLRHAFRFIFLLSRN